MPIKYAIRTRLDVPLTEQEQYMVDAHGHSIPESKFSYEDVPPIVAEMDEENGVYAVFSKNGEKLSQWLLLKKPEVIHEAARLGRIKPGSPLKDSIKQRIKQGDYLLTHRNDQKKLELSQVVRNMKVKTMVENLSCPNYHSTDAALKTRTPESHIKIPIEMIEGGTIPRQEWKKHYSLREAEHIPYQGIREQYTSVNASTALESPNGHFGYFHAGELVTGWIPCEYSDNEKKALTKEVHSKQKLVHTLDTPLIDALGTEIHCGDFVFSNSYNTNEFILCEVIGFSKDKVRLMGYQMSYRMLLANRIFTLNHPKNIVKLPMAFLFCDKCYD